MYATITALRFDTPQARDRALAALDALFERARTTSGFLGCAVVRTGDLDSTMITLYRDAAAAAAAGDRLGPELRTALGPHVAGPPTRWAGDVVAAASAPSSAWPRR